MKTKAAVLLRFFFFEFLVLFLLVLVVYLDVGSWNTVDPSNESNFIST